MVKTRNGNRERKYKMKLTTDTNKNLKTIYICIKLKSMLTYSACNNLLINKQKNTSLLLLPLTINIGLFVFIPPPPPQKRKKKKEDNSSVSQKMISQLAQSGDIKTNKLNSINFSPYH